MERFGPGKIRLSKRYGVKVEEVKIIDVVEEGDYGEELERLRECVVGISYKESRRKIKKNYLPWVIFKRMIKQTRQQGVKVGYAKKVDAWHEWDMPKGFKPEKLPEEFDVIALAEKELEEEKEKIGPMFG